VYLSNPDIPSNVAGRQEAQSAATAMAIELRALEIRQPEDLDKAFAAMARDRPDALLVFDTIEIFADRRRIIEFAARNRLPTMFLWSQYVDDGGLMAYGPVPRELFRGAAGYVDRILRGAKPAELPIQQPTIFELSVNLRTARALGLSVPQSVLIQAERVVE
jgi:putative ABC transport system substrate-binding protein